jgi:hypothetical protein
MSHHGLKRIATHCQYVGALNDLQLSMEVGSAGVDMTLTGLVIDLFLGPAAHCVSEDCPVEETDVRQTDLEESPNGPYEGLPEVVLNLAGGLT